jgi:hypothetical protein
MSAKAEDERPRTAGELRRLIGKKRYSWSVDPRLRDADQLPIYPRGGELKENTTANATAVHNVFDYLREKQPPANVFLRQRWIELNLHEPGGKWPEAGSPPDLAAGSKEARDGRS